SRFTIGLLADKIKDHGFSSANLNVVKAHSTVKLGKYFQVEFFRVTHSIPGCFGLAITTPVGVVIHTGDFKMDQTPVDHEHMDYGRLADLGKKGVLLMASDSTNVERDGFTPSEREVGTTLKDVFNRCDGRIILATFASHIHRIQQIIDAAVAHNRRVAIVGRSMLNTVRISQDLRLLKIPPDTLIEIEEIDKYPKNKVAVVCTGSQGEPMSALSRMAGGEHRRMEIMPGDTVVISATPIPGNEKLVGNIVNRLFHLGAEVIHEAETGVHTSGHASREEQKMMLNLVKPKFFIPVHGEYRHLVKHAQLANRLGMPSKNIFIGENGQVIQVTRDKIAAAGTVTSGQILVDGLGVGDVGNVVLRDRKQLSEEGILIVVLGIDRASHYLAAGPDIVSRGFVYVKESDELMDEVKDKVLSVLDSMGDKRLNDWNGIRTHLREALGRYLYERTRRRPMIIPIIMEIG
ncbi:MAG: ribonuclease J, partial [Clostridiales bacterium]|nr:ribonuclease J [Clostridiales bacterium]